MGLRTTLLLLAAVGGLGALLFFTDEKPPAAKSVETAALDGRQIQDCKRMRWQFIDQAAIEVAKDATGGFSLSEPIVDVVSAAYLRQIMTTWDSAQMQGTDFQNDAKGQQETGLDTPELVFVVEWPDGKKVQIDVGAPGPLGSDRFLRRDGRIYRGGNGLIESMRVGLDDLRERAVFRTMESQCTELEVEQIQITGKRERLHLERAAGVWRLKAPMQGRADPQRAIQFVTAVLSLRADHFPPGVTRFPDRDPEIQVVVRGARGEESVKMWIAQGAVFGQMPGRGVTFTTENQPYAAIFENAAQDLRATVLVPIANLPERLGEAAIDPGQGRGDRIRMVRSSFSEDWRLVEPVEYRVGATPANELIQALNNLRAIEFVDGVSASDPATGLGAGRLQVSVRELDEKAVTTLWIGADVMKKDVPLTYACRGDDPTVVVLVPRPATDQLRRAWASYCNLDVLRLTVPIERIDLRKGTATRTFRSNGAHWVLDGAEGNRDEVGGFANDSLRDLRGKVAVDLRGGTFGEPDWMIDLCRENGDVLQSLRVWDRSKEAPLVVQAWSAQVKPGSVGFEVAPQVAKSLREFWQ